MTIRIYLLGPVQISRDDVSVNIPGHRPLALLAYLLVTGKAHSRQHLVDLLFDGPDDPRAALRWTLSKLRRIIGDAYILADRQQIAFNDESDFWLDVTAFEAGQLELYRGDFLEGLHLRDAFGFEDWLFFERERLRASYQGALEERLAEAENRSDDTVVVEMAHQLLRLDNLREDWYRGLMRAYARQGKREAALAQFNQCRQVLQAELGVEPVAETVALAEAIQQGQLEPPRPGPQLKAHLIARRFIIDDLEANLLGQGNMGRVYRGRDTQTGKTVAVKVIKPDIITSQPHLVQRFIREGEVLRRLNHPNIVKMLAAPEEEGRHYLIMEYVEGGSLQDLLKAQGRLPIERVLDIALDLADALTRAHRLNIIHRDLKPANVLLAVDGSPRLADFGIARIGGSPQLTQTGLVMGTADYLSPEACEGKRLDTRTDIWALGVLLYEMVTGDRPFIGDSLASTLTAILTQPVPNLTEQRPEVPDALADLIYRMLEKEPQQRLPSVRLVGAELEFILQGGGAAGQKRRRGDVISPLPARTLVPPHIQIPPRPRFPTSLIGRKKEMATLRQVWQQVVKVRGQIVLVEGEPGIGKTRLVEELLTELAEQAVILRAKCPELQDPLAYTLFVDPLRQALAGERSPELSNTWLAEVSRLLPELHDRYPNLLQPASLDPSFERRRLFDAVCTILLSLTTQQPLVLFGDDLQWVDSTSLELLNHLSNRIGQIPILILGAYRSTEVVTGHPLQRPRRDWQRTGLLTPLALKPLSGQAVADLLKELTTWPGDDPSFGDLIYRETAGNPLFVVETVAGLRDEGRLPQSAEGWHRDFWTENVTIPNQVQTLIETRLNRLDQLSRQIGSAAAVMRSSFQAEVVQAVSGRNELETLEGLERLLASGLLVEQGIDRFTFSHDKIREVAYQSLSQLRRQLLHRRVAETLARRHRGREKMIADRLAYHYEQGGSLGKALDYHLQAGHSAREQYAHKEAISHYQKALALFKDRGNYEGAARTLMQMGLTYHNAFDFGQARQAYQEGFALWQRVGEVQPATLPPAPHALRLAWDEPDTLDPTFTRLWDIHSQIFSGLVEASPELEVIPNVARSWEVLENGRKYLFHLRDDVRWSDGAPVTAADFEYAWKRILDPSAGSPNAELLYDVKGARAFHQGEASTSDEVGIKAIDEITLVVELEGPTSYFLHLLTNEITYPVPQHIVGTHGEAWTAPEHIVTNGPFRVKAWHRGESAVLVRNPSYHGRITGNVELVELTLSLSWDSAANLKLYEANRLDIAMDWHPPPEMDRIRQQHAAEYVSAPWLQSGYLGFNVNRSPFDDPRVRRAFALAIDKERLAGVALGGYVFPATGGFIPRGMPGHSEGIALPYDPAQARRLLAEAGYPEGNGFPDVAWLLMGGWPIAEDLQVQWRENLGIALPAGEVVDFAIFANRMRQEAPPLFSGGWVTDYPDPDSFLRVCFQQPYFSWRHETYHRLVEEARRVADQGTRLNLYQQADRILVEEALIVPLFYGRAHLLVKPWVRKYPISAIQWWFWKDVIIEPH